MSPYCLPDSEGGGTTSQPSFRRKAIARRTSRNEAAQMGKKEGLGGCEGQANPNDDGKKLSSTKLSSASQAKATMKKAEATEKRVKKTIRGELSKNHGKQQKLMLSRFKMFVKKNHFSKRMKKEGLDMLVLMSVQYQAQKRVEAGRKPWTVGTIRTKILTLLGALARSSWIRYDKGKILKRVSPVQQMLRVLQSEYSPKKSESMTMDDLERVAAKSPDIAPLLLAGFLTCGRVEALVSVDNRISLEGGKMKLHLQKHKTARKIGPKTIELKIPPEKVWFPLQSFLRKHRKSANPFCLIPAEELSGILRDEGFGLRSLRRGGAMELFRRGVALEEIRQLTLHTTIQALMRYLDIANQDPDVWRRTSARKGKKGKNGRGGRGQR